MDEVLTLAERRQKQSDERRSQTAVVANTTLVGPAPRLSFTAETLMQALPRPLVEAGAIEFNPHGQPKVAAYDPVLLAPNPQRGRVVDRDLEALAASLDEHGQQETILARLITPTDHRRWPEHFTDRQLLLILNGHRIYFAQPNTKLRLLRVELLLPAEGEDDVTYSRRALRRASIKLMHSQSYTIFDKVNAYMVWREEFAIAQPKDADVAAYFDISRSEAQRLKLVSQLDEQVARAIVNSDRRPADEIVVAIANRPAHEQRTAFERFGDLTVATVRTLLKEESPGKPAGKVSGPGRPRNYVFAMHDDEAPVTYISTAVTAQEWQRRGGAKAFLRSLREVLDRKDVQERLTKELG
jgi:hypothetical protein